MEFKEIFEKYWDNLMIGIISGLVLYYGLKIQNGVKAAFYIFIWAFILILIYSYFVWTDKKNNWDNKIKNIIFYMQRKWKLILYLLIAGYFYLIIHEWFHYNFIIYFGYSAKYCWSCIPTKVIYLTPLDQVLKSHYFLSAIAPYLLSTILLCIFLIFYLMFKKKIFIILAITPFIDTSLNILAIPLAYITKESNDFLNLFRLNLYWETILFMIAPLVLFMIIMMINKRSKK